MKTELLQNVGDSELASPNAIEAIYAVAHSLFESQRIVEAIKAFRVMIRIAPSDERSWLGLGSCHEYFNETEVAAEMYGSGSVVAAPSARCLLALARVERQQGGDVSERYEEAAEAAEAVDDDLFARRIRLEGGCS